MVNSVSCEIGGKTLTIETGKIAKQADGSVIVGFGDSRVLVTVCAEKSDTSKDFLPLTVEFCERFYATGKIPGSFLRREGKSADSTLSARLIDRPLRPLFPEGFSSETQIVATILSLDMDTDVDMLAAVGASAALSISDIPFNGPTAGCRIGRKNGELIVAPGWNLLQAPDNDLDVFVAGTKSAIMMVEGGANEVPEDQMLEAIMLAHEEIKKITVIIEELKNKCGKQKREVTPPAFPEDLKQKVISASTSQILSALTTQEKLARYKKFGEIKKELIETLVSDEEKEANSSAAQKKEAQIEALFENQKYTIMRNMILKDKKRIDGRSFTDIRPISVEAGLLPRAHGSSLFTRGETQVMAVVTFGTSDDEQIVDSMFENSKSRFMLNYNFPPFSVNECGRMGGQSRREVGHGALAKRSITPMIPTEKDFPYTIRVVCETMESNGSSSMGSVCSSSMALMDAGAPFKKPIAGIAMGLIKEASDVAVLSDILGDEDHLGDMDFKVAGTKDGVTGIQMDIKIEGINSDIMKTALAQAKEGRLHILGEMAKAISEPRVKLSPFAPQITTLQVPVAKIREVIGSGGKVIRDIISKTGCKVDIDDNGTVSIASADEKSSQAAIKMVEDIIAEAELGKVYKGVVKKIVEFGAFVGILPNQDGLLHISEIALERVNDVNDYLKEGDEIEVKVLEIDRFGKVRLSHKVLLPGGEESERPPRGDRGDRDGGGDRGGRDRGDRGGRSGGGDRGGRDRGDRGGRSSGGGGGGRRF